jgi:BASS family bile acid:Na+ symporter
MNTEDVGRTLKKPLVAISGLLANFAVPVLIIVALKGLLELWHNSDELQNLLVGLALIISMPIAGSSTAWAQNADGNLTLSLTLVILSTLASPFTTPFILNIFGAITLGDYSTDLQELSGSGTNIFMFLTVVIPSFLGIIAHFLLGEKMIAQFKPALKLANYLVLLLLNYSNASISLPQAFAKPDWDFLGFVLGVTGALCLIGFGSGFLIAKALNAPKSDQASLMFGLGMNNNGTGLVLAGSALSDHPAVFLPMIFYTLIQQLVAASVDAAFFKEPTQWRGDI